MNIQPIFSPVVPVALASLLSGGAALTYQSTWQRVLSQSVGADAVSTAIIVAVFMAGLGVGAGVANRIMLRPGRDSYHKLYAVLEIAIGLFGLASVLAIRSANAAASAFAQGSLFVDVVVNAGVLLVPIVLMGMTTPLVVEIGKRRLDDLGRRAGLLYGMNILGAALGAAIGGLVLIEIVGLTWTASLAAISNFVAAGLVLRVGKQSERLRRAVPAQSTEPAMTPAVRAVPGEYRRAGALIGCVLLGYASIALQMVFFRVLANYFTLSSIVFPVVLSAFLVLMAMGQQLGGWLADRVGERQHTLLLATLYAVGAVLVGAAFALPPALATSVGALVFSPSVASLVEGIPVRTGDPNLVVAFLFSLVIMSCVVPHAALFPVVVRHFTERIEAAGHRFAEVYAAYAAGNVAGSLITGLVLFDLIGTSGAVWSALVVAGAGIVAFTAQDWPRGRLKAVAVTAAGCIAALLLVPRDYYLRFSAGRYVPTQVFEGRTGVVTVVPTTRFYTLIDMFRTESASAIHRPPADGDSYDAWRWNFSDLLALDRNFRPRTILLIGIGHGYLPRTLLEYDFVEKIVVVDIASEVVRAVAEHSSEDLARIFHDPRVEIVIADGRRYLQNAVATGSRFDLIQNRINEPWRAGGGSLFTVELFGLMKRALNPGGYIATRHMTGYAANALAVFAGGVWTHGSYHMYFSDRVPSQEAVPAVDAAIRTAFLSAYPGRQVRPDQRTALDITHLTPEQFRHLPLNTDDRPTFEYYLIDDLGSRRLRALRVYLESFPLPSVKHAVRYEDDGTAGR